MRRILVPAVLAGLLPLGASAFADTATTSTGKGITAESGAEVYQHVCQGCHMPGGRGAVGAGHFPALAHDQNLASPVYPATMVLNGRGGMPWFNGMLSDQQIANVVNYVRTHFGNDYKDTLTPSQVAGLRGPAPMMER